MPDAEAGGDDTSPDASDGPEDLDHDAGAASDASNGGLDGAPDHPLAGDGAVDDVIDSGADEGRNEAGTDASLDPDDSIDPGEDANPGGATTLYGTVTFAPDYLRSDGSRIGSALGQLPGNTDNEAYMPYLFVCAIDRDGERFDDDPVFAGGDDVLGCARTNETGSFTMPITAKGTDAGDDLYLVTWFCDEADVTVSVLGGVHTFEPKAEVCVRMNTPIDAAGGTHRKFLRSPEYKLNYGRDNWLNWNLSCPDVVGSTQAAQRTSCAAIQEEPAIVGHTHSSVAYNKEFVQAFRTSVESARSFLNLRPVPNDVAVQGCGVDGMQACKPCTDGACSSEISIHLASATRDDRPRKCDPKATSSSISGFQDVCLAHGQEGRAGTYNPFVPCHQVAHLMMRRWMNDANDAAGQCPTTSWLAGNDEGAATAEGFANFMAVVCWFSDEMPAKEYDGYPVQNVNDPSLAGTCGATAACTCGEGELLGEARITRMFIDLWDDNGDDPIDMHTDELLELWSTFDLPSEAEECGPHGRNMADFRDHYARFHEDLGLPSLELYDQVAASNCVDRHRDGDTACAAQASCVEQHH